MHEYLMEVDKYFGGTLRFQVTANSKSEALDVARNSNFFKSHCSEIYEPSLRCIRKLKPSFGKEEK